MDMTMLDVTDVECAIGDVVTLIGRDASECISVEDVARAASMSPYELLTGLRGRLERHYIDAGVAGGENLE
jgi:alanine racemase